MNTFLSILEKHKIKIIIFFLSIWILVVYFIINTMFSGFLTASIQQIKAWSGFSNDIIVTKVESSILEPAQRKNEYILVTGLEIPEKIINPLIALINLTDKTINLFPYNLKVQIKGWEYVALWMLGDAGIENYFKSHHIYITENLSLDKKLLIKRINNKEDWDLFKLVTNKKGKKVPITSLKMFDKLLLNKLDNYETADNIYYSLLLNYVIPEDLNFEDLKNSKIDWKPLYNQKDLLSLSEKTGLFIKERNKNTSALVPFFYVDVQNQYMNLLRLDKVTPYLKTTYKKQ